VSGSGARVAVVGATGALGGEVLAALDEAHFEVGELVPIASDRSLGSDVELRGQGIPVETELARLRGADLAFLCAPPAVSLEAVAIALRAEVPAIDLSGALTGRREVPLAGADASAWGVDQPLLALPPGPALAWLRVLAPIDRACPLRRVVATALLSASALGRGAIAALGDETVALLGQGDPPEPRVLDHPVAFDCLPWVDELAGDGASRAESELAAALTRVLDREIAIAVTLVRVPTFCGDAAVLALETDAPAEPPRLLDLLRKAEGIELAPAPTTRAAAGSGLVHVGRLRSDPTRPGGVLLWLAADSLRIAAAHAVRLAEARLGAAGSPRR